MSADQRVTLAREYLTGARQRDINYLPPSRMAAELAETRHQLGQVLAAIADQAATVLAALEDASEGIRQRAAYCPACRRHPADLCEEDADRLARADAYDRLAAKLREVVQ